MKSCSSTESGKQPPRLRRLSSSTTVNGSAPSTEFIMPPMFQFPDPPSPSFPEPSYLSPQPVESLVLTPLRAGIVIRGFGNFSINGESTRQAEAVEQTVRKVAQAQADAAEAALERNPFLHRNISARGVGAFFS
jgi:hypothetical protein